MGAVYGAGTQPAGWTAPAAYYPLTQKPPYVVFPDSVTGASDTGRYIDPSTRRFVYTQSGDPQGMPTVAQLVLIAWGTISLSAAVPTFDSNWQNQVQMLYVNAAKGILAAKLMQILSFTLTRFGRNGLKVVIKWKDLTTSIENTYSPTATGS
jgi:hypothetical protein